MDGGDIRCLALSKDHLADCAGERSPVGRHTHLHIVISVWKTREIDLEIIGIRWLAAGQVQRNRLRRVLQRLAIVDVNRIGAGHGFVVGRYLDGLDIHARAQTFYGQDSDAGKAAESQAVHFQSTRPLALGIHLVGDDQIRAGVERICAGLLYGREREIHFRAVLRGPAARIERLVHEIIALMSHIRSGTHGIERSLDTILTLIQFRSVGSPQLGMGTYIITIGVSGVTDLTDSQLVAGLPLNRIVRRIGCTCERVFRKDLIQLDFTLTGNNGRGAEREQAEITGD